MSIVYSRRTRRQFLVGSGQTLLALPFLPSLIPSYAHAQASVIPRRMMNFAFDHHNESEFWLNKAVATTGVGSIGMKEILLSSLGSSSSSVISTIMSNPLYSSLLTKNQITIIRGLAHQLSQGNGHVTRAFGGHSTAECGDTSDDPNHQSSFDFPVEISPTVYSGAASNVTKSIRIDLDGCWTYVQKTGTRSVNPGAYDYGSIQAMYNSVFGSLTNNTVPTQDLTNVQKTNILIRVFPAFQSFKNNRKISSEDKLRLDQHLSFLSDLQKSVTTVVQPPSASCTKPASNFLGATKLQINQLYVDLLVAAFKCGLTKFASFNFEAQDPFWLPGYTSGGGFHGTMHGEKGIAAQNNAYTSYHQFGYNLVADRFLSALNVEEGSSGRTYADNMITNCMSHLGMQSSKSGGGHWDGDVQHVIFGSMGGRLRSGRFYVTPNDMPNNTFIMTMLNMMDVPPSEYIKHSSGGKGYGYYKSTPYATGERVYSPIIEMIT